MPYAHDKVKIGERISPIILLAPLAVLSPGPRLAGTPMKGK